VDHRDTVGGDVRVSVVLAGAAVRGPAGMRYADPAGMAVAQHFGKRRHLADRPLAHQPGVDIDKREPGRIVAAILQSSQPVDEQRHYVALGDRGNNSAHVVLSG